MLNIIITAVCILLTALCTVAVIGCIRGLQSASLERAKTRTRRFLEFNDYKKSIGLTLLLLVDLAAQGSIIYFVLKIWKVI